MKNLKRIKYVIYRDIPSLPWEYFISFAGAFFGITLIIWINQLFFSIQSQIMIIGSFGASCVLIYAASESPFSQPKNVIFGHIFSAFIGVCIQRIFGTNLEIAAPLAVGGSIFIMQITNTIHPPGGATALIAVIGSDKIKTLGFLYLVYPVFTGAICLIAVGIISNSFSNKRKYPANRKWLKEQSASNDEIH